MNNLALQKRKQRRKELSQQTHKIGHSAADRWAAWKNCSRSTEPNKYAESSGDATEHMGIDFIPEHAEFCEGIISCCCDDRDRAALECYYVLELDYSDSSQLMTCQGYKCDSKRFYWFLEIAKAKLEAVYLSFETNCEGIYKDTILSREN